MLTKTIGGKGKVKRVLTIGPGWRGGARGGRGALRFLPKIEIEASVLYPTATPPPTRE